MTLNVRFGYLPFGYSILCFSPKNFAQQPTIVNDIRDCPIELPHYNGGVNHVGGDIGAAKLGGNFHHERVNKVDAYAIFQYKTRNYGLLSKEEIVSFFLCK